MMTKLIELNISEMRREALGYFNMVQFVYVNNRAFSSYFECCARRKTVAVDFIWGFPLK